MSPPTAPSPGLLISVRSAEEALVALAGGATIIDVKEPVRGSLGRADDEVITSIVRAVAGSRPVSAALGELLDEPSLPSCAGLCFVKWGLACCAHLDWRAMLTQHLQLPGPQGVIVAYADAKCAQAPSVDDVVAFACQRRGNVLLLDTHCKDESQPSLGRKSNLLDWLSHRDVSDLCQRCREADVRVALAGSLGLAEIEVLLPARPAWFAVRGAVCDDRDRSGAVRLEKVQAIVCALQAANDVKPSALAKLAN